MTKEAFDNAIGGGDGIDGGSTNAVLHLLAIAYEAGVELELADFDRVGRRVPHIADTNRAPHKAATTTSDIDRIGGLPVVMRANCSTPACSTAIV